MTHQFQGPGLLCAKPFCVPSEVGSRSDIQPAHLGDLLLTFFRLHAFVAWMGAPNWFFFVLLLLDRMKHAGVPSFSDRSAC